MGFLCCTWIEISTLKGLNLVLAMRRRKEQRAVEKDKSFLTLENATLHSIGKPSPKHGNPLQGS